jgi:hypothetical protein
MAFGSNKFGINYDFMLEVAKGNVTGHAAVNVQGRAPSGLQTTATDLWERGNATPTQQTLTSPTVARVHNIVSSSASDDGSPAGVGARTVRVYGLTSWTTAETTEDITMNGTTDVATVNSYVHINRLKVLTAGATGINVGAITATAATDTTVSAHMLAGLGQTQMAIYALPSIQTAYIESWRAGIKSATTTIIADISLKVNESPTTQLGTANYITKEVLTLSSLGSMHGIIQYTPGHLVIPGPAIIKLQGTADANDVDCVGGFNLLLVNN